MCLIESIVARLRELYAKLCVQHSSALEDAASEVFFGMRRDVRPAAVYELVRKQFLNICWKLEREEQRKQAKATELAELAEITKIEEPTLPKSTPSSHIFTRAIPFAHPAIKCRCVTSVVMLN